MEILKQFKAYCLVSLSLCIHRLHGQEYVESRCVTSEVYIDEAANVTCYFSMNLQQSSKSFRLYRYDFGSSSTGSQQQDKYVIVLDCFWTNLGDLECDPMPTGYEFNRTVTDQLTVTIPKMSLNYIGRYECRAQTSYPQGIKHCFIVPKDKTTTTALMTTDISSDGSAAGIAIGVILTLLFVAGIVFFLLFRRRARRLIPCFRRKPVRQRPSDGRYREHGLDPLISINESTTQGPLGNIPDSEQNRENLDGLVSTDCEAAADKNENTPSSDSTTTYEPPSTSDKVMGAAENNGRTDPGKSPPPLEHVHVLEPEAVEDVGNDGNDKMQHEREASTVSENNRHTEKSLSIEQHDGTTSGDSLYADEGGDDLSIPSTRQEVALVTSPEAHGATGQSEADRSDPLEEEKPATAQASDQTKDKHISKIPRSDIVVVLEMEGFPSLNWRFHKNEIKSRPNGQFIEKIHKTWAEDLDHLDRHDNYIQWLFPTSWDPDKNLDAQVLSSYEAEAIRSDEKTSARFFTSFKIMLNYFGLQLEDTGEISSARNWDARSAMLRNNDKNYRRVSRILKSLGELGHKYYQKLFIEKILMEVLGRPDLKGTLPSCSKFWIPLVQDQQERTELVDLYNTVSAELSRVTSL